MAKGDHLGEFELLVLLAILRLDEDAYGMTVRREVEETAEREVTLGSVYGTLDRLEKKGLVRSWRTDPDPTRGGHPRRYFEVTGQGQRALYETQRMHQRMWAGLELDLEGDAAT
jgi:PadR family transcriptional regulator PadR